MPFKSLAQERWGNSATGRKALGPKLGEFNSASKGLKLPARVGTKQPLGGVKPLKPLKPMNLRQAASAISRMRKRSP